VGEAVIEAGEEAGFDGVLRRVCVHLENAFLGSGWQLYSSSRRNGTWKLLIRKGKRNLGNCDRRGGRI
jgi:hypothetical protein